MAVGIDIHDARTRRPRPGTCYASHLRTVFEHEIAPVQIEPVGVLIAYQIYVQPPVSVDVSKRHPAPCVKILVGIDVEGIGARQIIRKRDGRSARRDALEERPRRIPRGRIHPGRPSWRHKASLQPTGYPASRTRGRIVQRASLGENRSWAIARGLQRPRKDAPSRRNYGEGYGNHGRTAWQARGVYATDRPSGSRANRPASLPRRSPRRFSPHRASHHTFVSLRSGPFSRLTAASVAARLFEYSPSTNVIRRMTSPSPTWGFAEWMMGYNLGYPVRRYSAYASQLSG